MSSKNNTPENFLNNFSSVNNRISKVDKILGNDFFRKISQALSEQIRHAEKNEDTIVTHAPDKKSQTQVHIQILYAATEFETAVNLLRLVNLPAVNRQIRVSMESIAMAIFFAFGRDNILKLKSDNLELVSIIQENPEMHLSDLYEPDIKNQGKQVQRTDPKIKGGYILPAFIKLKEELLDIDFRITNSLNQYIKSVLHPASHSSADLIAYHGDSFESTRKFGAYYDESRIPIIRELATQIYKIILHHNHVLEKSVEYLKKT